MKDTVPQAMYEETEIVRGNIDKILGWFLCWRPENDLNFLIKMRNLVIIDLDKIILILKDPGHADNLGDNFKRMKSFTEVNPNEKLHKISSIQNLSRDIAVYVGDLLMYIIGQIDPSPEESDVDLDDFFNLINRSKLKTNRNEHQLFCDPDETYKSACRELDDIFRSASYAGVSHLFSDPG
jgi:hypothetical protein